MATARPCPVCPHVAREEYELAYMTGERVGVPFSRAQMERHMSHVADPDALRIVFGMASAAAIAGRLRHLESQATTILDQSMQLIPATNKRGEAIEVDGQPVYVPVSARLALQAIREVRGTMELQGRIAGTLVERVQVESSRPDLDAQIAARLAARGDGTDSPATDEGAEDEASEPSVPEILALPRGDGLQPDGSTWSGR